MSKPAEARLIKQSTARQLEVKGWVDDKWHPKVIVSVSGEEGISRYRVELDKSVMKDYSTLNHYLIRLAIRRYMRAIESGKRQANESAAPEGVAGSKHLPSASVAEACFTRLHRAAVEGAKERQRMREIEKVRDAQIYLNEIFVGIVRLLRGIQDETAGKKKQRLIEEGLDDICLYFLRREEVIKFLTSVYGTRPVVGLRPRRLTPAALKNSFLSWQQGGKNVRSMSVQNSRALKAFEAALESEDTSFLHPIYQDSGASIAPSVHPLDGLVYEALPES